MLRAMGKDCSNLLAVIPAMIDKIRQLFVFSAMLRGSSLSCCGLQPNTNVPGLSVSISSIEQNLLIFVTEESFSEVPSLAEQQAICSG
jgi:hypothetical protein